jgi:imidazolonepropionase-like amidohydrolase
MKKLTFGAALLAGASLMSLGASVPVDAAGQPVLVVQGGTLIDGNGGNPVPNSTVIVTGNRITQVGRNLRVPAGAQVINAEGKWVIPGLIDAKANYNWQYGEAFLHWGVTSAMISGARNNQGLAERDAINAGLYEGPRLYQTGINVGGPGPMVNRPNNYVPGAGDFIPRSSEEAVAHVRASIAAGIDFITFANGDGPPQVFDAAVKETLRAGKGVAFRAMGPQTRASEVCAMGNGIVYIHTGNVGAQIARDPAKWATYIRLPPDAYSEMDEAKVGPMIQKLVACNAYLEPDLIASARTFPKNWRRHQEETNNFFTDPNLLAYYPRYSIEDVKENVKGYETFIPPDQVQMKLTGFRNQASFLKRFVDAGGKIVAASDITQSVPGLGLHQEIAVFVEDVGLTPKQALLSATSWVADGFKIADIGRIQQGKLADIVVLDADPHADHMNLRKISTVIKDGKVVDRAYDPNYKAWMFHNSWDDDYGPNVSDMDWVEGLKEAAWNPNANATRGERGIPGRIPDFNVSPTPAIEKVSVHTVMQGSQAVPVVITGFNYTTRSQLFAIRRTTVKDEVATALPTQVVSRTELRATIPANFFAEPGKVHLEVRNPLPLQTPRWGANSNRGHILVPLRTTTAFYQPPY